MSLSPEDATFLTALSDELQRSRGRIDGVEAMVSDLIRSAVPEHRATALMQAQSLDVLSQELDALSVILRRLGDGAAPDQALSHVTLAELATRLGAVLGLSRDTAPDAGEIELF